MHKIKNILFFTFLSILISGCQTIKEKTDKIVEKENEKLSKFIGKSTKDLQIELGNPNEDFRNENGNLVYIYNTKKYGIPCERKFEINTSGTIVKFSSSGCI